MRTPITIDDDLLAAAKALASQEQVPIGEVVSRLMRNGLRGQVRTRPGKSAFPVFDISEDARPITWEAVKHAEEEE